MNPERSVVYTAIFGGRDKLHDPCVVSPDTDYVCFSDVSWESDVWAVNILENPYHDPRRFARQIKILSHLYFPHHDYSLWVDGSVVPAVSTQQLLEDFLGGEELAVFSHPKRICLYEEGRHCLARGIDKPQLIEEQLSRYQTEGYPEHNGLAETAVLLRKHSPAVCRFNSAWWSELSCHSVRDQLSFNYALWREPINVRLHAGNFRTSSLFSFHGHCSEPS